MLKKFVKYGTLILGLLPFTLGATQPNLKPIQDGKEYTQFDGVKTTEPTVALFFSFYCPHCYNFEYVYKINEEIEKPLEKGVFKQYHVNFMGGESENLSRAWVYAKIKGVDKEMKEHLFKAVRANQINSMNDIKDVFVKNTSITGEEFDNEINSFSVNNGVAQQEKIVEAHNVRSVPSFYVNGIYRLNSEGMPKTSIRDFIKGYNNTIKQLLNRP